MSRLRNKEITLKSSVETSPGAKSYMGEGGRLVLGLSSALHVRSYVTLGQSFLLRRRGC
jgi:hypothetical protein